MPVRKLLFLACLAATVVAIPAAAAPAVAAPDRAAPLGTLLDEQTQAVVVHNPELRTILGISGDGIDLSGQLTDVSPARRQALLQMLHDNLAALE